MKRRNVHARLFLTQLMIAGICIAPGPIAVIKGQARRPGISGKKNPREEDNPRARLQALREQWGEISPEAARNVVKQAQQQRNRYPKRSSAAAAAAAAEGVPLWKSIGPTSANFEQNSVTLNVVDSGRLRTILPHPSDANIVYVLSAQGGLWKTTNFLSSIVAWTPKTDFIGSTAGGSVAFGKTPDTLYLGTGDPFDIGVGGFIVKSTDDGENWSTPIFLSGATQVLDIKVDSSGPSDVVLVGTDNGFFRSTDGGNTYNQVASLSLHPNTADANRVWSLVRTSAGWLASSQDYASIDLTTTLYLSTDLGASWNAVGTGFSTDAGRTTLAVGEPGDNIVYAYAETSSENAQLDLFRSTDGGDSWTALGVNSGKIPTNPNTDQPDMDLLSSQSYYNQMILVDPTDSARNTIYLGGQLSSAKSTDGGGTWTLLSNWLAQFGLPYVHADMHTAAFSKLGNVLFFGSDGGIFFSTDQGASWDNSKNSGLVDHQLYSVISGTAHPEQVLIGLQDDGIRFRDGTSTVYNQVRGGDGIGVGWSQANDNVTISAIQSGRFRVCHSNPPDNQSKFTSAQTGLSGTFLFFTPLTTPTAAADSSGNTFFTCSTTSVFQGTNVVSPTSFAWTNIFNTSVGFSYRGLHSIGVGPDLQHIGVAGTSGKLLLTTSGFSSFSTLNMPSEVPGYEFSNSNVTWANNDTVYITSVSTTIPPPVHVAKSDQAGATGTWVAAQNGLPTLPVDRLLVDPRDATGQSLYAATLLGVYYTSNAGADWQLFGAGLPQVRVTDLYVSPDGQVLRAATYGRGLWEINFANPPATLTVTSATGRFVINGQAAPHTLINIYASPNLITPFQLLGTTTSDATGAFQYNDTAAPTFSKRFYRAAYP